MTAAKVFCTSTQCCYFRELKFSYYSPFNSLTRANITRPRTWELPRQ